MTIYTGIDIIEIERIKKISNKFGKKFYNRIFTEKEQLYCNSMPNSILHFAARFCAKEAVVKALKTGFTEQIKWKDIEIINEPSGAPVVNLTNKALEQYKKINGISIDISLSHSETIASAIALIIA